MQTRAFHVEDGKKKSAAHRQYPAQTKSPVADLRPEAVLQRRLQDIRSKNLAHSQSREAREWIGGTYAPIQTKRNPNHVQTGTDLTQTALINQKTVNEVLEHYNTSLNKGSKLFFDGLDWFNNAPNKKKPITSEDTINKVETAGYKYFWFFQGDAVVVNIIRGEDYENLSSKEVSFYDFDDRFDDDQDYFYSNTFNVKTGEFCAEVNYKNRDQAVADEEGLTPAIDNSEIIWFTQLLAREVYQEKNPEAQPSQGITSLTRSSISNAQTLSTIFMCDENRVAFQKGKVTLTEPTEEAMALLGTPNANSAVWLLIQHADPGAVDIASIDYTADSITVHYMDTEDVQDANGH